jgi:hypothetical protein
MEEQMSFASRASRLKHELRRSRRIETPMIFINDPEEGLDEFRLPDEVLARNVTIEIGRPDPGTEPEDGPQWVARLTRETLGEA